MGDKTISENESPQSLLLTLNDDCLFNICEYLRLSDLANIADTSSRLRFVARDFVSRKRKKIEIKQRGLSFGSSTSQRELAKILSKFGENILTLKFCRSRCRRWGRENPFIFELIKKKCKNLTSMEMCRYGGSQLLQGFQNLKQLKVDYCAPISIDEWTTFIASNPKLEVLYYDNVGRHPVTFTKLLTYLPKLHSLELSRIRESLRKSQGFQHLLQVTGLKKLFLNSIDNLNGILVDLAKCMNFVELGIIMEFNNESLNIIKKFQNLEVLSLSIDENFLTNITDFPPRLKHLKMNIRISCQKFLEIVQHLTFLNEFDLTGEIYWNGKTIGREHSLEMVTEAIDKALMRNRRKLKIRWNYVRWNNSRAQYLYRSDYLQVVNTRFIDKKEQLQRIFVNR